MHYLRGPRGASRAHHRAGEWSEGFVETPCSMHYGDLTRTAGNLAPHVDLPVRVAGEPRFELPAGSSSRAISRFHVKH